MKKNGVETGSTINHASKCRPLKSSFDRCLSFPAMAFRIMAAPHKSEREFSGIPQHAVDLENLRHARRAGGKSCALVTALPAAAAQALHDFHAR